jgi:hypothetical protein
MRAAEAAATYVCLGSCIASSYTLLSASMRVACVGAGMPHQSAALLFTQTCALPPLCSVHLPQNDPVARVPITLLGESSKHQPEQHPEKGTTEVLGSTL